MDAAFLEYARKNYPKSINFLNNQFHAFSFETVQTKVLAIVLSRHQL